MISNFIGTMTRLFYFNHLSTNMQSFLMSVSAHPNRSKLRGIHLKSIRISRTYLALA
jgi:hypothetical protein